MLYATLVGRQRSGRFAPFGILLIVEDVIRAQSFQDLGLFNAAGCGDDASSGSFGELRLCKYRARVLGTLIGIVTGSTYLQGKNTYAPGSLRQDRIARFQCSALQSVKSIPSR